MSWRPSLGAIPEAGGTRFRVLAPFAKQLEIQLEGGTPRRVPMTADGRGYHDAFVRDAGAGALYRIVLDGQPFPDPASRSQPEGVHGPSRIVDPAAFRWRADGFRGVPLARAVIYELHVGTFTPEGTFAALTARLPALADLGVTVLELMPLADFPGARNWGYDGAALFAPAHCYGAPDDLRRLVDTAHGLGLAVHADVVYNHFGPDGAYAVPFDPEVFSERHRSPWGAGVNLDGPGADRVRDFFIENALHWIHEYRMDGLRLDATHAMVDDSPRHFLTELAVRVRETTPGRHVPVIAEDGRNWSHIVKPREQGGWGLDAVWADDFHHSLRRLLAGDSDGYFRNLRGTAAELAAILRDGWRFGPDHAYGQRDSRTSPAGLPPESFVIAAQNHDQIGNRAFGERLHHQIEPAAWRAASALLLLAPQTPLLFMGQEWAASAPFHFFTDHAEPLGSQVTRGRLAEFAHFEAFQNAATLERIPDPQAPATFAASRPDWAERNAGVHAATLRLYRALLALRREHPALARDPDAGHDARALDADTILLTRTAGGARLTALVRLRGAGTVDPGAAPGTVRLTTEDPPFAAAPRAPRIEGTRIAFERPGAVVFEAGP